MLTTARATVAQEYFWYLRRSDPEPSSYALQLALAIEGPLDRAKLAAAVEACVARHGVFRTALREIDGVLHQVLVDLPPFRLELVDRSDVPDRDAEIERMTVELAGDLDVARGGAIAGRLVAFGPTTHALIVMADHAIVDAASIALLQREILLRYTGRVPDEPAPQYIDYAARLEAIAASPDGTALRSYWRERLAGVRGIALPGDFPRTELDARRAAAPYGIVSDLMLPTLSVDVPAPLRERIGQVAAETGVTASSVYLAAYLWLLRERSGRDDVAIENLVNPRAAHKVEQLQGAVVTWTIVRCDLAACATLRDAIRCTTPFALNASGAAPIPEYYATVPSEIRGITFNYMPAAWARTTKLGALTIDRWPRPFPRYRRHWELMLFVVDSIQGGKVNFTGNQRLFRPETVRALAERYLAILEAS